MATSTVYGNKKTRKYHSQKRGDQCRQQEIVKENLVKFADAPTADQAGYKPCKACYQVASVG